MVTRRQTNPPVVKPLQELTVSRGEAKGRLQERIEKGHEITLRHVEAPETFETLRNDYFKWNSFNSELLKRIFTTDDMAKEYNFFGAGTLFLRGPSLREKVAEVLKDIEKEIHRLDSIIERLELIPLAAVVQDPKLVQESTLTQPRTKKVFVVHGRDEVAKTNLEVFLQEVGLEAVVLHRQPDEGMTIIEKFEKHSDVGYAFILLTPDEVAYLALEESKPDAKRAKEFRARPNVIFEFGYFVGKLGRSRVCCLYTGSVSLPSDVSGMIYKRYEKSIEEVAYGVIKDLKAAGYAIK